jgi:hypothetical protein
MNKKENHDQDNSLNRLIKFEDEYYKNENSQLADIDVSHLFNLYDEEINLKEFSNRDIKIESQMHGFSNIKQPSDYSNLKIEENDCFIKSYLENKNPDVFCTNVADNEIKLFNDYDGHDSIHLDNLKATENQKLNPSKNILQNNNSKIHPEKSLEKSCEIPENYFYLSQNLKDDRCDNLKKFSKTIRLQKFLTGKYLDSFKSNFISYIDNQKKLLIMDLVEIENIINTQTSPIKNDVYKEVENKLHKFKMNLHRICEDLNKLK